MAVKDDFYIGWQDEAPPLYSKFVKIYLVFLIMLILIFSWSWVSKGLGFMNSRYEYGTQTEFEGIIYEYPVPMLLVYGKEDSVQSIPLVNFGKFGVAKPLAFFKSQMRNNLEQYKVKLRGTVIEFDDKVWLELTDEDQSLISFEKLLGASPERSISELGESEVQGEIVDPKCFFGVMKPGYGKVHLSCAIRCISGGIPPILVSPRPDGTRRYYFISDTQGQPVNDLIVNYVGLPIKVTGMIKKVDDWEVIEIGAKSITLTLNLSGQSIFSTCNDSESLAILSPFDD